MSSQVQNAQTGNQIRSENLVQRVVLAKGRIMREGCSDANEIYDTASNNDEFLFPSGPWLCSVD